MGTKYSTVAVSGYNSAPPSDDGAQTASNLVKWSTHKTKLGDPLNTAIASINSALVSALDNSARSISSNDSAVAGDNARTLEVTGTTTVTLMLAATAAAGYWVNIVNAGSNTVTVAPTATDTIDGVASSFTLPAGASRALIVNSGLTGYNTFASYNVSKNHTVQGTLVVTGATTLSGGVDKLTTASGTVSVAAATAPTAGQALVATAPTTAIWVDNYGTPNLLINPNWQIDQINEGALYTYSAATAVGPDGWSGSATGAGVFKVRTLADPDNAALKCMEITCTTADASIATGDNYYIYSAIEGYDAAALQFGTASGVPFTVQFKFKTSVTGVYGISLANSAGNRRYIGIITVSNTSENEYSLTVTPDTTGTWLYTNGVGVYLRITLAAGATFQSTAGAWAAGAEQTTSAQCNFMSSTSNIAYLKRVQLIPGSVVQAYKPADIQKELAKCQRYYAKTFNQGVAVAQAAGSFGTLGELVSTYASAANVGVNCYWRLPSSMRSAPTVTTYNPTQANANWRREDNTVDTAVTVSYIGLQNVDIASVPGAATTVNNCFLIHATANARLS